MILKPAGVGGWELPFLFIKATDANIAQGCGINCLKTKSQQSSLMHTDLCDIRAWYSSVFVSCELTESL